MPDRRRTRERQLAKLAARRAAERQRKRRRRLTAAAIGIVVALAGFGYAAFALTRGSKKPVAAPSTKPTPSASTSVTPSPTATAVACGGKVPKAASTQKKLYAKAPKMTIDTSRKYLMTMKTSCGTIQIELDPKEAPNTVNSLVFLSKQHFFDGLTFHRIVKGFVIQGGDPKGDGTGGPGYSTVDPPPKGVTYQKGDLAMAKAGNEPSGTAGSQFFIVTGDPTALNQAGTYALVGHVVKGLDVAEKIQDLPTTTGPSGEQSVPVETVYIVKVTVKVET
jgi:cyclophilin family peptidyl-prolyl cis-trans isomerase